MGAKQSNEIQTPVANLVEDPMLINTLTVSNNTITDSRVIHRQGTYMPVTDRSGKNIATVVVTPNFVLFTLKFPPYTSPATVYGNASDLLNPNHKWVLNSETLSGACGRYQFDRVVYFKGDRLIFEGTQKGVDMQSGKWFNQNITWVMEKV